MTMSQTQSSFFFFNDTTTTDIYTLSLHDALPISRAREARHGCSPHDGGHRRPAGGKGACQGPRAGVQHPAQPAEDRKSTRLNSSHVAISYAVFCLKKKKKNNTLANNHNHIVQPKK